MKIAKRENNKIIVGENISDISNLNNSVLILLERGDKLKKHVTKKTRIACGMKNLHSVKELKEAVRLSALKEAKKKAQAGTWCMVCCDEWTTAKDGICCHCHIR